VRGFSNSAATDKDGNFTLKLPEGKRSLSIVHPNFSTLNIENVDIKKNADPKSFSLTPAGIQMEEFVVTAPHIKGSMASLLDERRLADEVSDVIGAEQMSKSGDSNAAAALKRVTGLTVIDGKYIFIRGLGGRYATVLLNRFFLPSPNPLRRVVPLDMFPTGVLESIVVQKSYSAKMPGDFGGGIVNLRTRSLPDKTTFSLGLSVSGEQDRDSGLFYKGGKTDWLGIDDGTRALPDLIKQAIGTDKKLTRKTLVSTEGYTDAEIERLGESLPNIYNITEKPIGNSYSGSMSAGTRYNLGELSLGFLASGLYGDEIEHTEREKAKYQLSAGVYQKEPFSTRRETERLIKLGASLSSGVDFGKHHKVRSFLAMLRRTVNLTAIEDGENANYDGIYRYHLLEWKERELLLGELWGEHTFNSLANAKLEWYIDKSRARQYQPDTREYRYELTDGEYRLADRNDGNERRYGDLKDTSSTSGFDLDVPFSGDSITATFSLGMAKTTRKRDTRLRRFGFVLSGLSAETKAKSMEDIATKENIGFPTGLYLNEKTLITDNYKANQIIEASYASLSLNLSNIIDISAGVRNERSRQLVETFNIFNPDEMINASLDTTHDLPAFNATWKISKPLQMRLGASKTVARPDFRELSPSRYIDEESDKVSYGNPDLKTTLITHYDTRLEFFPSSNEVLSIGGFYKDFKDPIEVRLEGSEMSFENAKRAVSYGAEFEFGLNLSRISKLAEQFKVTGNYTYIVSEIELGERNVSGQATQTATSQNRPMQGQAPYSVNFGLYYDDIEATRSIALLYNRLGPFISGLGQLGSPDEYEQPKDQLDFVFKQGIGENLQVSLKVKNILKADTVRMEEDRVTLRKKNDREFNVGLSAKF
jgi:hypothetical protein